MKEKALILGAGIQGIACALALQTKGYDVTLIDKCSELFNRASLRNEGKIHMGFVYANDPSFQTASLMLESSLLFAPLLEEWSCEKIDWNRLISNKFTYVIHKDSMVPLDQLLGHYQALQDYYQAYKTPYHHYLGGRPDALWQKPERSHRLMNKNAVTSTLQTEELAIDLRKFKALLTQIVQSKKIKIEANRTVKAVQKTSFGFRVEGETHEGKAWTEDAGIIVNCLWDNRLQIDATLGLAPTKPKWIYRLKYRLLGQLPAHLSSIQSYTFVLGPFGDIVTYPTGLTYLSWYPSCMRGWSEEVSPPKQWEDACRGLSSFDEHQDWAQEALQGLTTFFPGMDQFKIQHIDAGTIFSWGNTDIDDHGSELHRRFKIGIHAHDGYYSIDTGKFTSAPFFAHQLLEKI